MRRWLVGVVVLAVGCGASQEPAAVSSPVATVTVTETAVEPEPEPAGERADASSALACQHWINSYRDARDGVLTDAEFRAKLQEVEGDARLSEEPGVAELARELLAAFTSGDMEAAAAAGDEFTVACDEAGAFDR